MPPGGLEPPTNGLRIRCATSCATGAKSAEMRAQGIEPRRPERQLIYSQPHVHSGLCPRIHCQTEAACGVRTRVSGLAVRCLSHSAKAASAPLRRGASPAAVKRPP